MLPYGLNLRLIPVLTGNSADKAISIIIGAVNPRTHGEQPIINMKILQKGG